MKKCLFFTIVLLTMSSLAFAAPIDLSTWTQRCATSAGNWVVSGANTDVLQTINGSPTYFVSNTNYINTTFEGSFGVETTSDDDFIGFVFGFGDLNDYLLFDWKQNRQSSNGFASDGFTLSKITNNDTLDVNFWDHTGSDISILATKYGDSTNDTGWADHTVYKFRLDYTTTGIKIGIAEATATAYDTIFDVTGTFSDGAFGFYNYSQSYVRYTGFEEDPIIPGAVPEPSTILLISAGLLGLVGYSRKRSKK